MKLNRAKRMVIMVLASIDLLSQRPRHEFRDKDDTAILLPRGVAGRDVWVAQRLEGANLHLQALGNLVRVEVLALGTSAVR